MDKIAKALEKLTPKEREKFKIILIKIQSGRLLGFDLKKLKGLEAVYRVRVGKIRVLFLKQGEVIKILALERRSDNTY